MKKRVLNSWKYLIEKRFFGVCAYVGEKLGLSDSRIRLSFIYASFLTLGSPILIYLAIAFWMDVRNQLSRPGKRVWDL